MAVIWMMVCCGVVLDTPGQVSRNARHLWDRPREGNEAYEFHTTMVRSLIDTPDREQSEFGRSVFRAFFEDLKESREKIDAITALRSNYVKVVSAEFAVELVRSLLLDPDIEVRMYAIKAVGMFRKGGNCADELIALSESDLPVEMLVDVIDAMGRSRDEVFLPSLETALKNGFDSVRSYAAKGLGELSRGRPEIGSKHGLALLADPSVGVRVAALSLISVSDLSDKVEILGEIALAKESGEPSDAQHMDADAVSIRRAAAWELLQLSHQRPEIGSKYGPALLEDPSTDVRKLAVSLIVYSDLEDKNSIVERLRYDDDREVSSEAFRHLKYLEMQSKRERDRSASELKLIKSLIGPEGGVARVYALKVLGAMNDPQHLPLLRTLLKDADAEVREAAREAIDSITADED